jgi:hypothetical protein
MSGLDIRRTTGLPEPAKRLPPLIDAGPGWVHVERAGNDAGDTALRLRRAKSETLAHSTSAAVSGREQPQMTDLVVLCNTLALVLTVSHQPLVSDPDRPPAAGDGLAAYLRAVNDGNCSEPMPAEPILDIFEVLGHQQDGVTVLHGWLPYVDGAGRPDAAEWFTWRRKR